jgi:hypothetical protein
VSVTATYTVWCDYPDCVEWVYGEGRTATQARSDVIRRFGWEHKSIMGVLRDLCPEHKDVKWT